MNNIMQSEKWIKKNQEYLTLCINQIKKLLYARRSKKNEENDEYYNNSNKCYGYNNIPWDDEIGLPAIELLSKVFGLSSFERSVLILCAAAELDSEVQSLCRSINGSINLPYPTFSLALSVFPDAHWSALTPISPLRKFRLIDLVGLPQVQITKCQLLIQERILHYLIGLTYPDKLLDGIIEPIYIEVDGSDSHNTITENILRIWKGLEGFPPLHLQLIGSDEISNRTVAGMVCNSLGINLWQITTDLLPSRIEEIGSLVELCIRESFLLNAAIYLSISDLEADAKRSVRLFSKGFARTFFLSTPIKWSEADFATGTFAPSGYFMLAVDVQKPNRSEQRKYWKKIIQEYHIKDNSLSKINDNEIIKLVNQFNLNYKSIRSAASEAMMDTVLTGIPISEALWSACRKKARPSLGEFAQIIIPKATMDDLVLQEREKHLLKKIIINVRQRYKVYEDWGFAKISDRGTGITALFSGESGTGKTMAAEVIANELQLDLFKIDLSMVVSKYIGETEKNLKKIFDSAEYGGAILFFDEADTLFGKRSEVKDSHDRYANIEIGYLLQRTESYRGLAILTTNLKNSIDNAFIRRMRFIVKFPFPNEKNRKEIWKRIFPLSVPLKNIDFDKLSKLEITGGSIHNIALGAAFLAAEDGIPISMEHIIEAVKEEYEKMERPIPGGSLYDF